MAIAKASDTQAPRRKCNENQGNPLAALVAGLAVLPTQTASAKDLCLLVDGTITLVGKVLAIPPKGACKTWAGYVLDQPGNVLSGVICTTSDGTKAVANSRARGMNS
jgi:hypothetical protein